MGVTMEENPGGGGKGSVKKQPMSSYKCVEFLGI